LKYVIPKAMNLSIASIRKKKVKNKLLASSTFYCAVVILSLTKAI
jgi:hypothetical protein